MSTNSNSPESANLTREEVQIFEAGRDAAVSLAKTFELWVTVGRAVELAWTKAKQRGTRHAFQRLLEQQGLAGVLGKSWDSQKSTANKLLAIIKHLPAIEAWRATLEQSERIKWAAPTTIYKRCPVFARPTAETSPTIMPEPAETGGGGKRVSVSSKDDTIQDLEERVHKLESTNRTYKTHIDQLLRGVAVVDAAAAIQFLIAQDSFDVRAVWPDDAAADPSPDQIEQLIARLQLVLKERRQELANPGDRLKWTEIDGRHTAAGYTVVEDDGGGFSAYSGTPEQGHRLGVARTAGAARTIAQRNYAWSATSVVNVDQIRLDLSDDSP